MDPLTSPNQETYGHQTSPIKSLTSSTPSLPLRHLAGGVLTPGTIMPYFGLQPILLPTWSNFLNSRFTNNLSQWQSMTAPPTTHEIQEAKIYWIFRMQHEAFPQDLKVLSNGQLKVERSRLLYLDSFLGSLGVIRMVRQLPFLVSFCCPTSHRSVWQA